MHIDHFNINAPKHLIDKEVSFFCSIFDLKIGFRPNFGVNGFWLYQQDHAILHITEVDSALSDGKQPVLDHVAIKQSNIGHFIRKLAAQDADYTVNFIPELKITQLFFHSPAGAKIEASFVGESID